MPEEHGVKELKEVIVGVNELAVVIISLVHDGVDLQDLGAAINKVISDEVFRAKLEAAVEGIGKAGNELSDLSISEVAEVATLQISYISKIVDALRGQPIPVNVPVKVGS